jgi:hypothetical protein
MEYTLTANIKTRGKVTDSGPMHIDMKNYSHREHDSLAETKQRKTKFILWFYNTENINKL